MGMDIAESDTGGKEKQQGPQVADGVHQLFGTEPSELAPVLAAFTLWRQNAVDPTDGTVLAQHETAAYFKSELAAMENFLTTKWGKADQWFLCYRQNTLCAVARLDVRRAQITLSHIVGRPRAMPAIGGSPAPVSVLVRFLQALCKQAETPMQLNAEVLSLLPLYLYFGFQMQNTDSQQLVAAFALSVKDLTRAEQTLAWAQQCALWVKAGWDKPVMIWRG